MNAIDQALIAVNQSLREDADFESKHPRNPKGTTGGGRFSSATATTTQKKEPEHEKRQIKVSGIGLPAKAAAGVEPGKVATVQVSKKHRNADANQSVRDGAKTYCAEVGLSEPLEDFYVQVDPAQARRIAGEYEAMPADDGKPETAAAYKRLGEEIQAQWDFAEKRMGIQFETWTKEGQPYANSREMFEDVRDNKHLYFFAGGTDPNRFLAAKDANGLSANDRFRAVHDLFGHSSEGFQFGPRGEENAWLKHSQMFSPEAQLALTTETRGQNSWVNSGKHNFNADGTNKNIAPKDRPYATQKASLLPSWASTWRHLLTVAESHVTEAPPSPPFDSGGASRLRRMELIEQRGLAERLALLTLIIETEKKVKRIVIATTKDILANLVSFQDNNGSLEPQVVQPLRIRVSAALGSMANQMTVEVAGAQRQVTRLALNGIAKTMKKTLPHVVFDKIFVPPTESQIEGIVVNVVDKTASGIPLRESFENIANDAGRKIGSILGRGSAQRLSITKLARDIEPHLTGKTLKATLLGLPPTQGPGTYKSAFANSLRVVRTELARGYEVAQREWAADKDWIVGWKWHLSAAHKKHVGPGTEICEENAGKVFKKNDIYILNNPPAHPNSYSWDTEAMTEGGWKFVRDLKLGDRCLTLRINSWEYSYQPVVALLSHYSTKLLHFTGDGLDLKVTPDHRCIWAEPTEPGDTIFSVAFAPALAVATDMDGWFIAPVTMQRQPLHHSPGTSRGFKRIELAQSQVRIVSNFRKVYCVQVMRNWSLLVRRNGRAAVYCGNCMCYTTAEIDKAKAAAAVQAELGAR